MCATEIWAKLSPDRLEALAAKLAPYSGAITQWVASMAASLGSTFLHSCRRH
ncbi:hypothetical protein [Kaistia adipata]|uniref:hypothetical protein n=1 Tax=Kaistia adipata TaxID=166954 RepID=UPI000428F8B3|nr:hypothetical protein [Kaistia adipata]